MPTPLRWPSPTWAPAPTPLLAGAATGADRADMGSGINTMAADASAAAGPRTDMRAGSDAIGADMGANTDAQHINTDIRAIRIGGANTGARAEQGQSKN